ncbi:MAG: hypothetical protein OES20_16615 [Gammaproteobacteria bacterium]|nr:hypothetical protein [Gammaproteobacteria bacterium]MDH3857463.1 hypothetical protein [Gammaproteobacteria bacterium]
MSSPAAVEVCGPDRFRSLWQRCLVDGATDDSATIHQQLVKGYGEPQRHYHTLDHIAHCLTQFDQCKSLARNPDALEIAVWFHDVIFEPGRHDNEAHSARLYQDLSAEIHDDEMRQLIDRMIMATLHDGSSLDDADASYMVDIDLSSFGLDWDAFLLDSQNLREENPHLSDTDYYRKLLKFHSGLLARPRFFLSDFFYQRFEQQARDNVSRYLEQVRKLT